MQAKTILANLILNDEFSRKVFPYLKDEYFQAAEDKVLFGVYKAYVDKYQNIPSVESLGIELSRKDGLSEDAFKGAVNTLESLSTDPKTDLKWLVDTTEVFCREQATYNAVREVLGILDDKTGKKSRGGIPKLLQDALGVSFDQELGHFYKKDWKKRFAWYHDPVFKIKTGLDILDTITEGGFERKSLNVFMAPTGGGKSLMMCSLLANQIKKHNLKAVYFTLEMADKKIAQRIDSNLLNIDINSLKKTGIEAFSNGIENLLGDGEFCVKEYPPTQAGANHFRHFLDELALKHNFIPDLVYVDYLNLCAACGAPRDANSYERVKRVAEELRGLAVERDICMISATQTNRTGFNNTDFDMEVVSDSFGLPMTVDFFLGLMSDDEMSSAGMMQAKQLKNRYGDKDKNRTFSLGVDKTHMRAFEQDDTLKLVDEGVKYGLQGTMEKRFGGGLPGIPGLGGL